MEKRRWGMLQSSSETGVLAMVLVGFWYMGVSAGAEGEAGALLAFKKSSIRADPKGFLNNWDPSSSNPCSWSGVSCSGDGQIAKLDFTDAGLVGRLHISDLTALPGLTTLLFSGNSFHGNLSVSAESCSFEFLDLSFNNFSERLSADSSLLSCSRLAHLNLSHNNLTGNLVSFDFGNCQNLAVLNLSYNGFSATGFPATLMNCHDLETLDVSHNSIQMNIPGDAIGKMNNLRQLDLSNNQFFGDIPVDLGRICPTIRQLDLSSNKLTGELPSIFISCSSLVSLNLGNNELSGNFLDTTVSSLTSLRYLYIPFNNITGEFPSTLLKRTPLQVLDLSSNALTGKLPSNLCSEKSDSFLEKLLLADNYLSGAVPAELGLCKNLTTIDLSFNNLTDSIPQELWALPKLVDVIMWANSLTGSIPEGICLNGGNLQTLILNNNFITGTLPNSIVNCTNLIWVSLSSNRLSGEIPSEIGNLFNLAILQLGNNSLDGVIPSGIGHCRSLIWLDLNNNKLTGTIPVEVAAQAGYIIPGIVSGKKFAFVRNEGGTKCRGAGGLFEFEGIRADRLATYPMVHSCPSTRIYSGITVYTFTNNGSMIYLDLSYNQLSGAIPESIGRMSFLQVLNLGHNSLTGEIPSGFGDLKSIGVLDLSHNKLHGSIPGSLGGLSFLNDLDVSNNNLTGGVPSGGQLTTFPASRYENNSGLCGVPLPPCGTRDKQRSSSSSSHRNRRSMAVGMAIGITFSSIFVLLILYALLRRRKNRSQEEKRGRYIESLTTSGSSGWNLSVVPEPLSINVATFEKHLRKLTFAHLLEATNGFSADSLIGSGGFGEVYKARMKDGSIVAIKKLVHITGQGDREFTAEMETIGKVKHRNLVPLLGYCKIGEERLLVYEYMKWGSLESVLHDSEKGSGTMLDWTARRKIAIGSARGLAFLHHSCIPHIIHRDMKSSNVLLDENMEARVSDFGMARLVNVLDTHLSVSTLSGTPGYVPPEYYQSFRCTTKGDVYSYGVVLLELLSGKKPISTLEFGDDNNLVGWAKQLHKSKRTHEILDAYIVTGSSNDAEMYQYLKIALECLEDKPYRRPTMIQVMAKFSELMTDSGSDILDGISLRNSVIDESPEKEL